MNYRELLKKYMNHVGSCEGTYFTGRSLDADTTMSAAEKEELKKIADEAYEEEAAKGAKTVYGG